MRGPDRQISDSVGVELLFYSPQSSMYIYASTTVYKVCIFPTVSTPALQEFISSIRHGRAGQILRQVPNARRRAAGGIGICVWPHN